MTDIEELERRITAALDRIGAGVEGLGAAPAKAPDPDAALQAEVTGLREDLEAEKQANAQLEERVKAIRERQETQVTQLQTQLDTFRTEAEGLRAQTKEQQAHLQRMAQANQQLQKTAQDLRAASADSAAEPHLINQAMMSELEGLRAMRARDRAEMDAILGQLKPLLGDQADA